MQKIIDYLKTFGVDANTSVTVIITIIVFALGTLASTISHEIKLSRERRSYKKSLLLILEDFSRACDKQSKVVLASLQNAGLISGSDFIITYVPIGTLDYLNKLDFNIFIQNFRPLLPKKNYSKAISKLFGLIAQIKIQNDTINEFAKTFGEKYAVQEKRFSDNMNHLRRSHDSLGINLNGKKLDQESGGLLVNEYFKIFGEWEKSGQKRDMRSLQEAIVVKCLNLNNNFHHPLLLQLNEYALEADIAYQNVEKIDKFLAHKYADFARFHRNAAKLTDVIVAILK